MKKTDFRKAYLSFARLYGAIYSEHAYQILKGYFPDLKKSVFNKDLRSRYLKCTRGYDIFTCGHQRYVITRDYYNNEDIDETFHQQGKKPFYIPDTFEEFVEYGNLGKPLLVNMEYANDLKRFIKCHLKLDEDEKNQLDKDQCSEKATYCLMRRMESETDLNDIFELTDQLKIDLSEEKAMEKFVGMIQNIMNNTRNIYNCGFTPMEMLKMSGPVDPNEIRVSIGQNMRKMFFTGEMDPFDYLESIEKSDLPSGMKESLKEEMKEIIKEIKVGKA